MYLVDTNIFLEVMLRQTRKDECKAFLNLLRTGASRAFVTDFSLYSMIIILNGLSRGSQLKVFLSSLSAYQGIAVYRNTLRDMLDVLEIRTKKGLDTDDSIQYSAARALKVEAIISFDKHFEGLEIPRMEPAEITRSQ